jgi:hypothetical protein
MLRNRAFYSIWQLKIGQVIEVTVSFELSKVLLALLPRHLAVYL